MAHRPANSWRLAFLAIASAASIACHSTTAAGPDAGRSGPAWQPDSAAILLHQYTSGLRAASRSVVTDPVSWATVWERIHSPALPQPRRPAVDFSSDAVLVASLGERVTGGFDIRVDSVLSSGGWTAVYVTTSSPGHGCQVPQEVTQPVQAVRLPRPRGAVYFEDRAVVVECGVSAAIRGP